ncbi:UNVERIFIED_CONTAM: Retrovirus-related Pol polyprotein from transposon TNT 1-94 [Sesamum radiatum]|uniref:Retrovirus-related Pol polyprotein from transposon TNT 1-94 n=1 Tax=Sesamum radiatum TaxID=300843 RepID=A0AAW2LKT1_SESRA
MKYGIKLSKKQSTKTDEELKRMSNIPYASAVRSIQYVVQCTRPDVAYALSVTSRYQACAGEAHWGAAKSILKYLKRTKDMFLTLASSRTMMMPNSNRVLYSTSEAANEAIWMKNYIQELGVVPSIAEPVVIFCDNNWAIAQAKEPRPHHHFKHILRRYHLLREMVSRGDCRMDRVSSAESTADPLTKPMSQVAHTQHLDKMGLRAMGD